MSDSPQTYIIGQELYTASVDEMRAWIELLAVETTRLNAEIAKKQSDRQEAESIFNKPL